MLKPEQYLQPDIARSIRRLDLKAKFIVEGFLAGLNRAPGRGASMEFAEHRKYAAGDDPRLLDWTTWARTDRLYVRTYRAETNLSAYLLVDTSRSMAYAGRRHVMTKLEYATALAAAIGYLLTRQGDAVGLGLIGSGLQRFIRPRAGRRQLVRVLAELAQSGGEGKTALAPGLHAVAHRVRRKGLMVLMSDLVDEPESVIEAVEHLTFDGHEVVVFQILDSAERHLDFRGPVILEDPETGARVATDADHIRTAYTRRMTNFVACYERGIRRAGGDFVAMTTSTPFDKALSEFLRRR